MTSSAALLYIAPHLNSMQKKMILPASATVMARLSVSTNITSVHFTKNGQRYLRICQSVSAPTCFMLLSHWPSCNQFGRTESGKGRLLCQIQRCSCTQQRWVIAILPDGQAGGSQDCRWEWVGSDWQKSVNIGPQYVDHRQEILDTNNEVQPNWNWC